MVKWGWGGQTWLRSAGVVFTIFIMVVIVGYVMTYGAFGTDPPTPFGVEGLSSIEIAQH